MKKLFFLIAYVATITSLNAQSFYKTPTGSKYHLANCRTVKNVSEKLTIEQIKELGLSPCKICSPANISSNLNLSNKTPHGQDKTVQCKGLTKKKTRCKHMTRIANGYCFQHNPD